MFKIGDFSRLNKVSVKALHYYDEIDLLKPVKIDENSRPNSTIENMDRHNKNGGSSQYDKLSGRT